MQKRVLIVIALFFMLSTAVLLVNDHPINAAETHQLIRIMGAAQTGAQEMPEPITLQPPAIAIDKGSLVIWVNWARSAQCVKVIFEDGKKCDDVTEAPTGFKSEGGCYVTSWITFGGTSSLRFTEPGNYTYIVEAETEGQQNSKTSGQITVK